MNCLCLLISPCELIFVLLIVNLNNMIWINYVNIYLFYILAWIFWNWHNAFHMHWGTLEY